MVGDLAERLDVDPHDGRVGETAGDRADLLGQRQHRLDGLVELAALDVDRVGDELAGQRQANRPRDGDAGLLLRLVGRGAEVRQRDHGLEGEQRRVGAGLLGVHVEAGAGHAAVDEGRVQRRLVDDAAASGVDDVDRGLDLVQLGVADEADRLGGLGQVHGDEVALGQEVVEGDHPDAELSGARGLHVGVVGDELDAEGAAAAGPRARRCGPGRRRRPPCRPPRRRCTWSASTRRARARSWRARRCGPRRGAGRRPARPRSRCWTSAR